MTWIIINLRNINR